MLSLRCNAWTGIETGHAPRHIVLGGPYPNMSGGREVRPMTGPLLALLFPEPILLVESLGVITVTLITCAYVKATYHPREGKTDKPREPESHLVVLAVLGLPLLGLLSAWLLTNHRITDPVESAEAFSHCLFWGIFAGLIAGVVIQTAASSRVREGVWDREMDGPIDAR